ncbi:hypothetical protein CSOJ01_11234 [Colletotrichum sojae]|uniref:Uncharacterized protein n=1 Tax=Colletotrichum sojae TaxID=2175907 RepID=A0A8H6IY47_9PEZI|nr:hypothetical protein CSOJ01_11234 [Colletotrichum sojae]
MPIRDGAFEPGPWFWRFETRLAWASSSHEREGWSAGGAFEAAVMTLKSRKVRTYAADPVRSPLPGTTEPLPRGPLRAGLGAPLFRAPRPRVSRPSGPSGSGAEV